MPVTISGNGTFTGTSLVANNIATGTITSTQIAANTIAANNILSTSKLVVGNMPTGSALQILSSVKTDTAAWSGATWIDVTGLSVTITPSSASSKFLVFFSVCLGQDQQHHQASGRLVRNGSLIFVADAASNRERCTFGSQDSGAIHGATYNYAGQFLDSPATTSALTYKIQVRGEGGTTWINRGAEADGDNAVTQRLASSITVMEIAG